jgi:hypothetical protein
MRYFSLDLWLKGNFKMWNFREIVTQIRGRFAKDGVINASANISKCDDPDQIIEVYSQWIPYKKNIPTDIIPFSTLKTQEAGINDSH